MLCLALKCLGSEFVSECLFLGKGRRWQPVVCGRVVPVCASGDRRRNVACVMGCAEVHGLPARQIKSGWFPADDVNWSTTAWSIVSLSLILHAIDKCSDRTAPTRARLPARVPTVASRDSTVGKLGAVALTIGSLPRKIVFKLRQFY